MALTVDQYASTELARLDGCYALRTDLPKAVVSKDFVHDRYKDLAQVEWAFRDSKSVHLEMRPVYLRAENRTRGHAVVVMLAYLRRSNSGGAGATAWPPRRNSHNAEK